MVKDWTPIRKEQYRQLATLIDECKYLNHGSGAIDKISKIIKTADDLSKWDHNNGETSFMNFLTKELNK